MQNIFPTMTDRARIFIYPPIKDQGKLNDVVSRLAWYLIPYLDRIYSIEISVAENHMLDRIKAAAHLDKRIAARLPKIRSYLVRRSELGLMHEISQCDVKRDIIFIVDETAEQSLPAEIKGTLSKLVTNGGRYRVDAGKTRQEGSFYLWAGLNKLSDANTLTALYRERFMQMAAEIGHYRDAYVFGTGPSFSNYVETHDFDDTLCIVANSIVKNLTALDRLRPRIICAADPIYHAGASSYAAAFRHALIDALEITGAWFVCPMRDAGIYRQFLPAHLERRMVCVPFDNTSGIPTDLSEKFFINPFPNVLTLLLLPLASTFAERIHIVGCDGRQLLDDSFFWSHDKKVQFNDEMADIRAAHPGFFAIDYNDYYLDHCLDLENVLTTLEEKGKVVVNETTSLIPALEARSLRVKSDPPTTALRTFVMIDPDAKDDWGHFLAYDKRLAQAAQANGLNFALLSRLQMEPRFKPDAATSMHPVFTVNSWTVGNKTPATRESVLQFTRELQQGIHEVEALYPEGDFCLFFYVGSIEVCEALEFLLQEHPRVHAVINLFWSYNFDQNSPAYRERWRRVARRAARHPRLHLMHATRQIAQEFYFDWDLELPVLEHPSTTFSDNDAKNLAQVLIPPRNVDQPFKVLFPGGARAEKGFLLSIEVCEALRGEKMLSLSIRTRLDKVSGPKLTKRFEAFDKTGIEIIDQDLSDEDFIKMIRSADIIVIPYHAEAFRRRTSGILVDAILLGKPVVVLKDTWLADIVDKEETGVSVAADASSIAAGVLSVARNYDRFIGKIQAARKAYLKTNTWDALLRHVCRLAGDDLFASGPAGATPDDVASAATRVLVAAAHRLLGTVAASEPISATLIDDLQCIGANHPVHAHFDRVQSFLQTQTGAIDAPSFFPKD